MKFLAVCIGIESATLTYSCIWCKCPAEDRYDLKKKWSVTNTKEGGARTTNEIQKLSKLKKTKK